MIKVFFETEWPCIQRGPKWNIMMYSEEPPRCYFACTTSDGEIAQLIIDTLENILDCEDPEIAADELDIEQFLDGEQLKSITILEHTSI